MDRADLNLTHGLVTAVFDKQNIYVKHPQEEGAKEEADCLVMKMITI